MATISGTAEINSVRLKEQGSDPSAPASGYGNLYVKSDGKLYLIDDDGTVMGYLTLAGGTMAGDINMADNDIVRAVVKDYGETLNALGGSGGATVDIDLEDGNVATATVDTGETTFTFSNPPATGTAGSFTLILTNGGSQTVNWPASVAWPGGTEPTLTAAGVDILVFTTIDGGTVWYGFAAGLDMS